MTFRLGFGSVAKVILRYSNQFLKENSTKLYLLRKDTSDFGYYNVSMTKCFGNDEIFMTVASIKYHVFKNWKM